VPHPQPSIAELLPVLVGDVQELLREVRTALSGEWPEYAQFLDEHIAEIGRSAEAAFGHMALRADAGESPESLQEEMFEEIGRGQWRMGQDLRALMSAYHVGARIFWRRVSSVAVERGVESATVADLAMAVFTFVDRLSTATARGYVLEQSEAGATRDRLRDELVGLLLSDRAAHATVQAAAERAEWPVPTQLAVVLLDPDDPLSHRALARLDPTNLPFNRPPLLGAVIANPARSDVRRRLRMTLGVSRAVVGVPVGVDQLPASLHIAEHAARLQRSGVLTDDVVFAADHLDAIIVHRDDRLLRVLRTQVLAPLADSTAGSRERLSETLVSWLRHMGDRQAVAAELHVHPQTVRYRIGKLHELFGDDLDDPDVRGKLLLALAWGPPGE
jgi:hypothetical protein